MSQLTIRRVQMASRSQREQADVIGRIEAVVIDEKREPVERVPGLRTLKATSQQLDLAADLPLIPGSHLMVQVGDRHAPGAENKRFEVEVIDCKKWIQGHEVRAILVKGSVPSELLQAA